MTSRLEVDRHKTRISDINAHDRVRPTLPKQDSNSWEVLSLPSAQTVQGRKVVPVESADVACCQLHSCNTTTSVVFWKRLTNAHRLQNLYKTRQMTAALTRITEGMETRVARHRTHAAQLQETRITNRNRITGLVNEQESQRDHRPNMLVPRVPHHHRSQSLLDTLITNQSSGTEILARRLIGTCAQI